MIKNIFTKFLLICFMFFNSIISNKYSTTCDDIILQSKNNENELLSSISKNMMDIKNDSNCLEKLITKGLYTAAQYLVEELSKRQIKFKDQLKTANYNISKKLKELYNDFRFEEKDYITASPAFQWAQNSDSIFIEIKYAHRFDAPGCLDVKKEKVNIEENLLSFIAYCVQGDTPIKFDLNIDLFDKVDQSLSHYNSNSVGRYQITLKKKEVSYWKSLLNDKAESPQNMRMWIEMREKYIEDIQKYIDKNEEEENSDFDNEINEIKKKQKDKPKNDGDL